MKITLIDYFYHLSFFMTPITKFHKTVGFQPKHISKGDHADPEAVTSLNWE